MAGNLVGALQPLAIGIWSLAETLFFATIQLRYNPSHSYRFLIDLRSDPQPKTTN
jgi:hypothetical protein